MRPFELIAWRNYSAIGGSEIDARREEFLRQPGADREQMEKEYLHAKVMEAQAELAAAEWDYRAGLVALREQNELAHQAEENAAMPRPERSRRRHPALAL